MIHDFFNNLDVFSRNKFNQSSFINNFISDLKIYIDKINSFNLISKLRPYSLLTFAKNDGIFAICFNYNQKKIYYIPKNKIKGNFPKPGEALKVLPNGTFTVDYTAILAEENKINKYLEECSIAK